MATIVQLEPNSYVVESRGARMVLQQTHKGWRMKTRSATTRALSMGGESIKDFENLKQVEQHYKSWRGIAALIESSDPCAH